MDAENNETDYEMERIAWFLEDGCLGKLLYCTLCSTQFISSLLQEAHNDSRQLTGEQLNCHGCDGSVLCQLQFCAL